MKYSQILPLKQLMIGILLILIAVGGCATSTIQENRKKSIKMASEEKIAVVPLGNRANESAACVQKEMQRVCPTVQFFPSKKFMDMLYPWFEPGTAPESKEDLEAMFNNRLVQASIDKLGVRYVVTIRGGTLKSNFDRSSSYFHFYESHHEQTDIFVSVCDLKEKNLLLKTETHMHDSQELILIGILPIWIPAITEAAACDVIVKKLLTQLPGCDSTVNIESK